MTDVCFYHVNQLPIERVLAKLVEKIYSLKHKIVIYCQDSSSVQVIDDLLWNYSTKTFLAHATNLDPKGESQPIYITDKQENPNNADILISIGNDIPDFYQSFERYIDIFVDTPEELSSARGRFKTLKKYHENIKYFKQDEKGNWQQL